MDVVIFAVGVRGAVERAAVHGDAVSWTSEVDDVGVVRVGD